ncbi:DEKNAAC105003 [Brettanomyces naardenensis]|uniref:DEKNAAC105003 n=1 Tax=Brettanomyces naardenensis TaxID=13370 RepID=A0A448YS89_BRENA|nr:DEKNAAC105003 [Brettanomyces naardenensis]
MLDSQISKPSNLVLTLTLVASILGFMFGYDTGYISSVLVTVGKDLDGRYLTIPEKEWISSATSLGAFLASLVAGPLADAYGRKPSVMLCDVLFVTGALMQFFANHVHWMISGRFVMGCGVGAGSLLAPLYISELAPGKFRGRLVTINCLAITGGQLIAYMIGALLSRVNSGWRYIVVLSLVPCAVQFIVILFLPDTPRFLVMHGKHKEASSVLQQVYPTASPGLIEANIEEIAALNSLLPGDNAYQRLSNGIQELFTSPSNRRALFIGCGLQAAQQFVGFNAIMYFSGSIFEMVGFRNSTAVSCLTAGTNFLFTVVSLFIIDKVGRRNILLVSIPFLILSQILCALAFGHLTINVESGKEIGENSEFWAYLVTIGLVSFVASYATGLGNVPWHQSELFPQSVRGLGSSFATATNWFGSMIVSASFLTLMKSLTPCGTFLLFAAVTAIPLVTIYFTYPELGSLQLEEVEQLLSNGFNVKRSIEMHRQAISHAGYTGIPYE